MMGLGRGLGRGRGGDMEATVRKYLPENEHVRFFFLFGAALLPLLLLLCCAAVNRTAHLLAL